MTSLRDQVVRILEASLTPSPAVFIIGTLVVLLVPVLLHFIIVSGSPYTSPPTILLAGPSGSGKTSFLAKLAGSGPKGDDEDDDDGDSGDDDGTPPETHTSQRVHSVELTSPSSAASRASLAKAHADTESRHTKFHLVDLPGHGKLRAESLSHFTPAALSESKARAAVFMLDASTVSDPDVLSTTATYLHDVLLALQRRAAGSKTSKAPSSIPVLVAPNKADLFTALPAALVRSSLEAEITRVRVSRSKGLLDSGVGMDEVGSEELDGWLGTYGTEKFSFDQMKEFDIHVDVVGGNVLGEGVGVDKWWKWIADKI